MFQMLEYPLGSKSSLGEWKMCAMPVQYFNMEKVCYTLNTVHIEDKWYIKKSYN